jgi:tRNA threonylcarbamoyladenosine biosynthesis protein TsaE
MAQHSLTSTFTATSPEAMDRLGAALGKLLKTGDVVLLYGDLGAGKTTFSRGLIQSISTEVTEVVSPTFTLVQTYPVSGSMIYHYDLYRLETGDASTLTELGWDESLMEGITLVEWPERLEAGYIPGNALSIHITTNGKGRDLEFRASERWQERLKAIGC